MENMYLARATFHSMLMTTALLGLAVGCGSTDVGGPIPSNVGTSDGPSGETIANGVEDDTGATNTGPSGTDELDQGDSASDASGNDGVATDESGTGGDTSDVPADDVDVDIPEDDNESVPDVEPEAPTEDDSSVEQELAACTTMGFQADREIAETDGSNYSYRAARGPDTDYDLLEIASYSGWNGPTAPGTYSLEGINYRDCGLCLRIWKGCGEESCEKSFYADEGLVQIDAIGEDGTLFIGSMIDVVFKESTFEDDYTSVAVVDGESWCLDGYTFAQEFGAGVTTVEVEPIDEGTDEPTSTGGNDEVSTGDSSSDTPIDDSADCTITLRAEVRDESGPCTDCNAGDYITVVGVIENSCSQDLTYQSEKSCLVSEFVVYNIAAGSSAEYPMTCDDDLQIEFIESGDRVTRTRPAGRLSSGDYELTVQFEDSERAERTLLFTVQ